MPLYWFAVEWLDGVRLNMCDSDDFPLADRAVEQQVGTTQVSEDR